MANIFLCLSGQLGCQSNWEKLWITHQISASTGTDNTESSATVGGTSIFSDRLRSESQSENIFLGSPSKRRLSGGGLPSLMP